MSADVSGQMRSAAALRGTRAQPRTPDAPPRPTYNNDAGRRRWPGELGLRARTTLALGAVATIVSILGGFVVWSSVAGYLLTQREDAAVAQALTNRAQVTSALEVQGATPPAALALLPNQLASTSLLYTGDDEWFTDDLRIDGASIPADLAGRVMEGQPLTQRIRVADRAALVVGLPANEGGAAYFEVFALDEAEKTLQTLGFVLLVGGVLVPLVSAALAWWAVRPALRPLEQVAGAAEAIAGGNLGARLDPGGDPSLRTIAATFNSTADALERRVKVDAKFAADVSHELRSPLTTLVSSVEVMGRHRGALSPEAEEAFDLLAQEVDGFQNLVQDLLVISRSEAGSDQVETSEFCLATLVERSLPDELERRLQVTQAGATALVRGDKRRLRQVVMNLVDNAERHGGGVSMVQVDATEDIVCLVVEDSGPGLRVREMEGIFDRFARGRGSDRGATDGAGLGLALVAQQARVLGGTVRVENRASGGARFVVSLPLAGRAEEAR